MKISNIVKYQILFLFFCYSINVYTNALELIHQCTKGLRFFPLAMFIAGCLSFDFFFCLLLAFAVIVLPATVSVVPSFCSVPSPFCCCSLVVVFDVLRGGSVSCSEESVVSVLRGGISVLTAGFSLVRGVGFEMSIAVGWVASGDFSDCSCALSLLFTSSHSEGWWMVELD